MALWWISGSLVAVLVLVAGFFFALHLGTNEVVPLQRARLAWRWALVVLLGTFDYWIFARVIRGIIEIW